MSRFFQLNDFAAIPRRWHLGTATFADGAEPDLYGCQRVDRRDELSIEVTDAGRILDFCLTSFNVPVVSPPLAAVLSDAVGDDVQLIPARIGGQTGVFVLNALRAVRCVDEARSEFLKWTVQDHRSDLAGQYRQITKLFLDATAIPADAQVFRIGGFVVKLVVTQQIKAAMESVGCFGANFDELPT